MIKNKSNKMINNSEKSLSGWDSAIADTEKEIADTAGRLDDLRLALQVFQEKRERGEPFPCSQSATS